MRFVTFTLNGQERTGVLEGDSIFAAAAGVGLLDLIRTDGSDLRSAGQAILDRPSLTVALESVTLRSPLPMPPTIRDFMTFERHLAGVLKMVDADASIPARWYEAPAFYFTNPYAVLGPVDDVAVPPGSELFDFELEVAAVIGKSGRNISVENAEPFIAGYMIMNDWSARDLQFAELEVKLGPTKGKDSATSLGPYLVTPDELEPSRTDHGFALKMEARVNGELIGGDRLDEMSFSFAQMVSFASRGTEVRPGDVLGSGTCANGCLAELWGRNGRGAHEPLRPGDTVSISVEGLGEQNARIVPSSEPVESTSAFRSIPRESA